MFDFISQKFSSIFSRLKGVKTLTNEDIQQTLEQVSDALLEADVPYATVQAFVNEVSTELISQHLKKGLSAQEQVLKTIHDKIVSFLGGSSGDISFQIPSITLVLGLQGAGKTTAVGKLAYFLKNEAQKKGKSRHIILASVDFQRPAAIDQLEILAQQAGVSFYRAHAPTPRQAALEIVDHFKKERADYLFLDTAGRLHVDNEMLEELRELDRAVKPTYKILVLDAMTGQQSLAIATAFDQAVGFEHTILAKMDSDARGGAAFSFRYALKKPITFIGVGEKLEDLTRFYPERIASRMLGMGDMQSLIDRANEKIKQTEQDQLMNALKKGKLTLEDFASQMDMMSKIGSLSSIMKMMPGMGSIKISPEQLDQGQRELKRFRAIINSMTPKERQNVRLLNGSRCQRIARGAGVTTADVNALIQRFQQAQQYVKLLKSTGPFKGLFR